jgi:predicted nuclease of restriction endonuclease-like (RecB) superfamily
MPAKKKTTIPKRGPATRRKPRSATAADGSLDFTALVDSIRQVHAHCTAQANRAVNVSLTLRNWVIGGYLHHYELNGQDRAKYGDAMIDRLAAELAKRDVTACDRQRLYSYLAFFRTYPQIAGAIPSGALPPLRLRLESEGAAIVRSVTGESDSDPSARIVRSVTGQLAVTGRMLLDRLYYTHLELLTAIDDPLKRAFYEIECIRGNWSVRALKRQIATLYFERSGLSKEKEKLAAMVQKGVETTEPKLTIRDPYIFEFLGLRAKDAVAESDLEAALVENLREFLLELGHGFCLEAQQKSIAIGRTRGFVDLVFYHRILKCHVLVELKVDEFKHEHLGQINTYVTWYRQHMMAEGDNPPVGLLLCTGKDHALVQYAIAGMDNRLFVSKYAVELPSREELEKFLHARHLEMLGND